MTGKIEFRTNETPSKFLRKEGWPDFPFAHWTSKPSLQDIACHLDDLAGRFRRFPPGVTGDLSPVERQIWDHVSNLQEQVAVLQQVVQALLQITDDRRPSQRAGRALSWVRERVNGFLSKSWVRTAYKVVGVIGAVGTLWFVYTLLVRLFHLVKK